jgi:C-terminal processing protease CtpA/Prc
MAHIRTIRHLRQRAALALIVIASNACASSFFQLSPTEENGATPAKKPAATAVKPASDSSKAKKAAPKPTVEKPATKATAKAAEKIAEKPRAVSSKDSVKANAVKPVAAGVPKSPPGVPAPAAALPPFMRAPEPIIEPPAVEPAPAASDSTGVAHLVRAAAVWDAIRLFHPTASTERAAWDNITVRRLTDVRAAKAPQQYSNVMTEWVGRLNDPVTRIVLANAAKPNAVGVRSEVAIATVTLSPNIVAPARGKRPAAARDTTIIVTWPAARATYNSAAWSAVRDATRNLQSAMHVVLDLRGASGAGSNFDNANARAIQLEVANNLATFPAKGPSIRRRVYEGWRDEGVAERLDGRLSNGATLGNAGWRVSEALATVSGNRVQFPSMRHVAIIADSATAMPPALLALVSSHQATLIAEGFLSDASLVPTTTIAIGNGLAAQIRTGQLLNADGSFGIRPDTTVFAAASSDSAPALKVALRVAAGTLSPRAAMQTALLDNNALLASTSWSAQYYPIMGARLLGAFKMYGTLRTFHAYSELHDEDLDEVFARVIPHVEAARDANTYAAAMLDLATATDDAQAIVTGQSITQRIGAASVPFRIRWIDNRAIVTQVANKTPASSAGVAIGDEITSADGYPMAAYISEHRRYGAASNDWTRLRNIMDMIPRGPAGDAIFRARDASGHERALTLQRTAEFANAFPPTERYSTPAVRALSGSIGYIDIDRVTDHNIDSAFTALANSRAIIFDARVNRAVAPGVLSKILRHVSLPARTVVEKEALRVAIEPCAPSFAAAANSCVTERRALDGVVAGDSAQRYRGRVVMLIDERTQGALEEFGLAMESAANAAFIGSPSAGASGAISAFSLPGQLTMTFSGSDVRHADGRQLQRVGLTPQVDARPTVKGVRALLDEPLDAAQKWLQQQLNPVPAKRPK